MYLVPSLRLTLSTRSTIASVLHAYLYDCGNKLKLRLDGGDSSSKKCKRDYCGASGGVWYCLRLAKVGIEVVDFVLVHLVEI